MNDLVKNQPKKLLKGHGKGRSHRKFSQFGNMYFGHYELKEVQNPSNSYIHQKTKRWLYAWRISWTLGTTTMAIQVVEFSSGGYKIRTIFARINIPKENY
jgi:hypothetical protein